ncbi:pyridoxamine 5'-phosphate oxidase family protein [Actinomadura verrucosospora]|uniref:Pyridoxamine 5'-phosphate oxidase-related FMN-binding protein n=1 Tax=Actinomadura verrucosospora TaxID=46165 RepID=A0A7D3ZVL7_ACTVE|nr:pyridoxamine 5'-phosphate oxidase family protein [Actinomadura verrucosospora]QKG20066.1 pyridoxamine 5'-phosphate oxidase-related FMN-binding protein [Actinomadura verrucosospora]
MARWHEIAESVPEFAAQVREAFEAHKHKTLATLRKDGTPRVSGIEAYFVGDDLWFGSMPGALKARDLQRDPRFALHGPPVILSADDPAAAPGDAKVTGRALEVTDPERRAAMLTGRGLAPDSFSDSHFFTADISEVVLTRIEGPNMVMDLWRPGQGLRTLHRP